MRLRISVPHETLMEVDVDSVGAEGLHGSFTMLPHHQDYLVMLVPSILTATENGEMLYVAVDGGTLVKVGDDVLVSTGAAVPGDSLDELEQTIRKAFLEISERERDTRIALARIETHVVQELFEFEERP